MQTKYSNKKRIEIWQAVKRIKKKRGKREEIQKAKKTERNQEIFDKKRKKENQ